MRLYQKTFVSYDGLGTLGNCMCLRAKLKIHDPRIESKNCDIRHLIGRMERLMDVADWFGNNRFFGDLDEDTIAKVVEYGELVEFHKAHDRWSQDKQTCRTYNTILMGTFERFKGINTYEPLGATSIG